MRAVIGEDHALLRDGLQRILTAHHIEVVATADNAPSLMKALREHSPDIAVVDVRMPPTLTDEGLRVAIEARKEQPGLPVLVLSQYVESLYARELLEDGDGGVGYLLKDRVSDVGAFIEAVKQVAGGGTVLDPSVVRELIARHPRGSKTDRLTDREREVLGLMAEGRSNAAIAAALFVTEKAISKHTNAIFAKLDLPVSSDDNRRVLAVLAHLNG
ncbi:DNA-binding response regulator [Flexivirga endophytica]|uniref:DNA-binding response regulator n=1 Tax=Flexivirga endophytica TaxID=1849103 RepID=A0A916X0Z1_9MICO|nr:response regulator transcription factor [Flexivirga endophytica]GGB45505.1 DNA-binding response regulator [Flexivirga endophytica]GHB66505.1 DNA-binding response regulator [Flexivirga endophytica]